MNEKKVICYKCHWLVLENGGFFKRKSHKGPCDKCLGQMTTFQIALEKTIWLQYIAPTVVPKQPIINKTEQPKP